VTSQNTPERDRRDHILPQGYLEGFTIPSKPGRLWVHDIERRDWFESSPKAVAAERGYYDYSEGSKPDATADQAFAEFEIDFPPLVRDLVASGFADWTKHVDFLVRYSQMIRARSSLFRQETLQQANHSTFLQVEEVLEVGPNPDRPGETLTRIRYSECERPPEAYLKNMTITNMRSEIAKGAGEFAGWNWHVRVTDEPRDYERQRCCVNRV
jgi:hypothetical protein